MPFIMGAIAILGAVYFFLIRAKHAKEMADELFDVANDVRLAARRFGFRRNQAQHPVDSIEDPEIALAAVAYAFIGLDDLPSREDFANLTGALRIERGANEESANELLVLARWIVEQCNGPTPAVPRVARKLNALAGADGFEGLIKVIKRVTPDNGLSERQREALQEIQRAFRLK